MAERDELRGRLESLESDLFQSGLAGPEAARRRGRQRSRRRTAALAGTVAVAATVVAVSPIGPMFRSDDSRPPLGPATGGETASPTATPAATFTDDVLLAPADLTPEDAGWETIEPAWAGQGPFACAQGASESAEQVLQRSFVPTDEGRIDQVVERYDGPGAAERRFDEIRATVADCAPGLDVTTGGQPEFWTVHGVGDAAWIAGYWTPETDGDLRRRVELGVVWTGTAVTHVTWGFLSQDAIEPVVTDATAKSAEQLCGPAGGSCVLDVTIEPDTEALERP